MWGVEKVKGGGSRKGKGGGGGGRKGEVGNPGVGQCKVWE